MNNWQEVIPEQLHDTAREALSAAFGAAFAIHIEPVLGGASGALTYRVDVGSGKYLLRMETRRGPMRNPHQYKCMEIAAEAGLAPAVRHVDDAAGVAIMDFIECRPLDAYPGGATGLGRSLGELVAKLQATEPFPVLSDYRAIVEKGLGFLRMAFAPGLLDAHQEAFGRIREAYPWDAARHVSSHNEINPRNILFDGERLWVIDWESAYRNDALTDIAILAENHAPTAELEDVLLRSWLGWEPDRSMKARLRLMRQMTRLYYAMLLLAISGRPAGVIADLAAPTAEEFRSRIANGQLNPGGPETKVVLCKMYLGGFLAAARAADFEETLAMAR